ADGARRKLQETDEPRPGGLAAIAAKAIALRVRLAARFVAQRTAQTPALIRSRIAHDLAPAPGGVRKRCGRLQVAAYFRPSRQHESFSREWVHNAARRGDYSRDRASLLPDRSPGHGNARLCMRRIGVRSMLPTRQRLEHPLPGDLA